jgi:hypothetical protein
VPGRSPVATYLRPNANFRRLWSSYAGSGAIWPSSGRHAMASAASVAAAQRIAALAHV